MFIYIPKLGKRDYHNHIQQPSNHLGEWIVQKLSVKTNIALSSSLIVPNGFFSKFFPFKTGRTNFRSCSTTCYQFNSCTGKSWWKNGKTWSRKSCSKIDLIKKRRGGGRVRQVASKDQEADNSEDRESDSDSEGSERDPEYQSWLDAQLEGRKSERESLYRRK